MKDNNVLLYGAIVIVAVLVFVGAALAVSFLAQPTYDVSLSLSANNSGATIYPYQITAFNIIVTNNGGRQIVGLPVAFYINGVQRNYSTYVIPAHQNISIPEVYVYTQTGAFLFSAAADPGNVLKIANSSGAKKSTVIQVSPPEPASVYSSVPNANIVYTETFTTSGTGLLSGSLMASLYNVSEVAGINGADNSILAKTYQDLYPYTAVANGAYSIYSNGTASYSAWLQGTVTPREVALVISSFGKTVTPLGGVQFSALSNSVSICSYYQGGWTRILELYNNSDGATCASFIGKNYTPSESNAIVTALKGTKIGITSSNAINSSREISWQHFYYNNATVLGQAVQYTGNTIAASTLFQLSAPQGIFLSVIKKVPTNVSAANTICFGLNSEVNGDSVCSVVLPTSASLGNQSYGAVYSKFVSTNYTVGIYSLINQAYLTLAHGNAALLISKLGINGSQVVWTGPFKNSCGFVSGFGCKFEGTGANSTINITITNLNYSSVSLSNITCAIGDGFKPSPLNGTLSRGGSISIRTTCHIVSIPLFAARDSFLLNLGFRYKNAPMIVNGTANVTTSG